MPMSGAGAAAGAGRLGLGVACCVSFASANGESSLTPPLRLSPSNPLRWASMGTMIGPCEAQTEDGDTQPQKENEPAVLGAEQAV